MPAFVLITPRNAYKFISCADELLLAGRGGDDGNGWLRPAGWGFDSGAAHASFTISPDGTTINIWGTGRTATNSGVVLNPITNATNLAINQSLLENT